MRFNCSVDVHEGYDIHNDKQHLNSTGRLTGIHSCRHFKVLVRACTSQHLKDFEASSS